MRETQHFTAVTWRAQSELKRGKRIPHARRETRRQKQRHGVLVDEERYIFDCEVFAGCDCIGCTVIVAG